MKKIFLLLFFYVFPLVALSQLTDQNTEMLRSELSARINELRIHKGLKPLIFNDTLRKAAEFHSDYMAQNDILSHDEKSAKYATPAKRVEAFDGKNLEYISENVLFSTPQEFPLNKKEIISLAEQMFLSWKNSPGHFANMTEPEYTLGDLGFATNLKKKIVYATQVFGKKGVVVPNQLSKNNFGIQKAAEDCEKEYENYLNLVHNLGNDLTLEGNEVKLYFSNIDYFKKIFSNPNDGIAIDLVSKNQLECGKPNQLDFSPIYDGIMLKPIYREELLSNNTAESPYRVITKVADIPENINGSDYSLSTILIKNGKACKYMYPATVPREAYDLRPIEPICKDELSVNLLKEGIIHTQIVDYNFNTDKVKSTKNPEIEKYNNEIQSVQISSFSSVEGDSVHNKFLHESRANYIKNNLISELKIPESIFEINAKENWELMNFQLNYYHQDGLSFLSHEDFKELIVERDDRLPWDSLLFDQRKSFALINYTGVFNENDSSETLAEFNLRTAIGKNDPKLANKAMFEMYQNPNFELGLLFEPYVMEFMKKHPSTVTNYSALLSHDYFYDPYATTRFIHSYLNRFEELDNDAQSNILHLYSLLGVYLLDNWDVSSERLSNVIHPSKIEALIPEKIQIELLLNLHLSFIQYFGQVNDGPNISKSFDFIANFFKTHSLKPEDDVDLTLFFNNWSMYHMTVDHLLAKYKQNKLNEDGLFVLTETMNFTNYSDISGDYIEMHKKALQKNKQRWCEWLDVDFQVLRNVEIKRMYCESCKN